MNYKKVFLLYNKTKSYEIYLIAFINIIHLFYYFFKLIFTNYYFVTVRGDIITPLEYGQVNV